MHGRGDYIFFAIDARPGDNFHRETSFPASQYYYRTGVVRDLFGHFGSGSSAQ